jgi:hypothetical protein
MDIVAKANSRSTSHMTRLLLNLNFITVCTRTRPSILLWVKWIQPTAPLPVSSGIRFSIVSASRSPNWPSFCPNSFMLPVCLDSFRISHCNKDDTLWSCALCKTQEHCAIKLKAPCNTSQHVNIRGAKPHPILGSVFFYYVFSTFTSGGHALQPQPERGLFITVDRTFFPTCKLIMPLIVEYRKLASNSREMSITCTVSQLLHGTKPLLTFGVLYPM